jgi:isopentenyl-diphosphate Delta-isomerase
LRCALPEFRYRATSSEGIVENEICPVFCGRAVGLVNADPAEVIDFVWVPWKQLCSAAELGWAISPWATEQVPLLHSAGLASIH